MSEPREMKAMNWQLCSGCSLLCWMRQRMKEDQWIEWATTRVDENKGEFEWIDGHQPTSNWQLLLL
jgi:hypothetical protein